MKKIIAVIIVSAICLTSLFTLMSCDQTPEDTKAPETTAAQDDATTAVEEQTTEAEEQTTEAEEQTTEAEEQTTEAEEQTTEAEEQTTEAEGQTTEAEGQTTEAEAATTDNGAAANYEEELVALYQTRATDHSPIDAADGRELACRFTVNEGERLVGLMFESCPTWTEEGSAFVVELYKWDIDYDNTLLGDPLYKKEFTDWIDNAACELDFTDKAETGFAAGSYLWVFRGTLGKIGIWALDPADGCTYFENGMEAENGFRVNAVVLMPA